MLHDIKITSPDTPQTSNVTIDGEQYNYAQAVRFEITADKFAAVELRILAQHFEYEGKAAAKVDAETAELLKSLGWTAPEAA